MKLSYNSNQKIRNRLYFLAVINLAVKDFFNWKLDT